MRRDRSSLSRLFRWMRGVFTLTHSLQIDDSSPDRLVIKSGGAEFIIDGRLRAVTRRGRILARFDAIRWIEIEVISGEYGPLYWKIRLYIAWLRHITIGMTKDDVQASIVAARIATLTGLEVKTMG